MLYCGEKHKHKQLRTINTQAVDESFFWMSLILQDVAESTPGSGVEKKKSASFQC